MLNIKKSLLVLLALWISTTAFGALSSNNPPLNFFTNGTNTASGVSATLQVAGADGYNILLDGSAVGTSTITVAIQVFNPLSSSYVTPATIGATANPITLTNGTVQLINIPGSLQGVQVNVTSFGTATGTFQCTISAY